MITVKPRYGRIIRMLLACCVFTALAGGWLFFLNDGSGIPVLKATPVFAQDEKEAGKEEPAGGEEGGETEEDPCPPCPPCPECPDPAKVGLNGLEEKKKSIALSEEALRQETKKLERFKEEVDEQLEALSKLKAQIDTDFARLEKKKSDQEIQKEAAFETKMGRLVKMYSGMKPKDAGEIINKMDLKVAMQLFSRMRETSSAQILSFVDSEKAARISEGIAFRKE